MTILKEMKKADMITIMLDNEYPEAWGLWLNYNQEHKRRPRSYEALRTDAEHNLLYHVLKADIYEMFRDYLYWKITKVN